MTYKVRYAVAPKWDIDKRPKSIKGTKPKPELWGTEEAKIEMDKRYAWMKHKAQANYRGEEHSITLDEWMNLWSDEEFLRRGRAKDALCLMQKKIGDGWHYHNVEVVPRSVYLARAREYRKN